MVYHIIQKLRVVASLAVIAVASLVAADLQAASPLYVRTAGDDALCNGTADVDYSAGVAPACAFQTVQKGIDDVDPDGVVNVGDGTWVEQLEIAGNLRLTGNGTETTIESPPVLTKSFTTTSTHKPIVYVHDADDVVLENFVVDGAGVGNANYRFSGVAYYNAGGTIDALEIKDVINTPLSGAQHGVGIYGVVDDGTPRHIDVFDCTIYDYQKNGMAFNGDDLSVEIAENDVTGAGRTDVIAQNGIQVSRGATGIVRDNTVRDNWCTHPTAGCTDEPTSTATADGAGGILLYAAGDSVEVRDNVIEDSQYSIWAVAAAAVDITGNMVSGVQGIGIAIWDADQWTVPLGYTEVGTSGVIRNNTLLGLEYGILNRDYDPDGELLTVEAHFNRFAGSSICPAWSDIALDATNNWWGDNAPDGEMAACGSVIYGPWLEFELSASRDNPAVGSDVGVTASLRGNSDDEDISAIGFLTDGIEIGFKSDVGQFVEPSQSEALSYASAKSYQSSALADGIATLVLTDIDETGPVTITGMLDNQIVLLTLDFVDGEDLVVEGDNPSDEGDGTDGSSFADDGSGGCGCRVTSDASRPRLALFISIELLMLGMVVHRMRGGKSVIGDR